MTHFADDIDLWKVYVIVYVHYFLNICPQTVFKYVNQRSSTLFTVNDWGKCSKFLDITIMIVKNRLFSQKTRTANDFCRHTVCPPVKCASSIYPCGTPFTTWEDLWWTERNKKWTTRNLGTLSVPSCTYRHALVLIWPCMCPCWENISPILALSSENAGTPPPLLARNVQLLPSSAKKVQYG